MNDYISREAARHAIQNHFDDGGFNGYTEGQLMMTRINAIPAADVVEMKRSQAERLTFAETLLSEVWDEIKRGHVDDGLLQLAVNVQIMCNRIVWKLNDLNNEKQNVKEIDHDHLWYKGRQYISLKKSGSDVDGGLDE